MEENYLLAAGVQQGRGGALYRTKGWWFFLVFFYCSPGLVAWLSKCEITLSIGNKRALKLFSFDLTY